MARLVNPTMNVVSNQHQQEGATTDGIGLVLTIIQLRC
jgi:hypothetical protein